MPEQHPLLVPPLYSPFSPARHPRFEEINARTSEWAERHDIGSVELRRNLVTHEIGGFAARILPEGREEVVQILADFVLWLFGVDDGHCEVEEQVGRPAYIAPLGRLLRVAQNPEAPMLQDDPLANGARDLRRRITEHGSPAQVARWVHALREYFFSVTWEAGHRIEGSVPDLADYTLMRIYDGATSVVLPLLEMGHAYELSSNERDQDAVRALEEMAFFVICWDNDIFSHHKESRSGVYYVNAVRVLEHQYGIPQDEALDLAIAQRDQVLLRYLELGEAVRAGASPELKQYLKSLDSFIRGAQDWGISSVRYTTPGDPANLPDAFSATPTHGGSAPLQVPTVAWWWDARLEREQAAARV